MKWMSFRNWSLRSRHLQVLLALEVLLSVVIVQQIWQLSQERQTALHGYRYQLQQWQTQQQVLMDMKAELPVSWLTNDASMGEQGASVVAMRVRDTLSISDWRGVLDRLQHSLYLVPDTLYWRREGEQWFADLHLSFYRPAELKPELNLLPMVVAGQKRLGGHLLSTLTSDRPAALIKAAQQERWWYEGSWLPALQATLTRIGSDYVELQYVGGRLRKLYLQGMEQESRGAQEVR